MQHHFVRIFLAAILLSFSSFANADLQDTDADGMPDAWEISYGFNPTDAQDAVADADHDGVDNLGEYYGGTSPTDANAYPGKGKLPTLISTYYGLQGWKMDQIQRLEAWQGRKNAVVLLYTNWKPDVRANLFKYQLPNVWNNGNIPLITWEPANPSNEAAPEDMEGQIASGAYDDYIRAWAADMKTFLSGADGIYGNGDDRRAYLSLGHEMNGVWYPWSANPGSGETPQGYIDMWQRVHANFSSLGLDANHLQWIWTVNNTDGGKFTAEAYYPGDAYVDWIGIDGYNWGQNPSATNWHSPAVVYGDMLARMRALANKPISFNETGVWTDGSDTAKAAKNRWIKQLYVYARQEGIGLVSWFNEDKAEGASFHDWTIFEGVNGIETLSDNKLAYPAYRQSVNFSGFVSADPTNPQWLTDNQFKGLASNRNLVYSDGDGVPDLLDAFPHDPHEWEDTDGDGIGNNADTDDDNDGMPDDWETQYGLNPLAANDAGQDKDSDGLSNLEEYRQGSDPSSADTDNDGMMDKQEVDAGRHPAVNEGAVMQIIDGLL
jgi:hypothetical protein